MVTQSTIESPAGVVPASGDFKLDASGLPGVGHFEIAARQTGELRYLLS